MSTEDCCPVPDVPEEKDTARARDQHLVILGGGSAAMSAAIKAGDSGAKVTIINDGLRFGGTCVNVGCVPSKALIRVAEAVHHANHHPFAGITTTGKVSDFKALMQQKRDLVDQMQQAKYEDIFFALPYADRVDGFGRIIAPGKIEVNGETINADKILIATGATTNVPDIPGLADSGYLTNESAFELDELPGSMIVLGGRYIALETAQMFSRLGTKVTILQRSSRILPTESADLTDDLTGYLEDEGLEIVTGVGLESVKRDSGHIIVRAVVDGESRRFTADQVLVATGRRPNTRNLGLEEVGIDVDERGFIKVNETLETTLPGVYAAGDVIGSPMFVYTAAYEAALATENALTGSGAKVEYEPLPWVIFTDPQVAGIGLNEHQAEARGFHVETAKIPVSLIARSAAAHQHRGFIKLIRDVDTDMLLGARILAPEGSELLMELALAIRYKIPVSDLATMLHPYLTLSEGVKLAAIAFNKDPEKLSCCAV